MMLIPYQCNIYLYSLMCVCVCVCIPACVLVCVCVFVYTFLWGTETAKERNVGMLVFTGVWCLSSLEEMRRLEMGGINVRHPLQHSCPVCIY